MRDIPPDQDATPEPAAQPSRRGVLMLGAISASAVVTIRPAYAQAAGSVMNCEIPVPDKPNSWIAPDGKVVPAGTDGAFAPPVRPLTGEQIKAAVQGHPYPGADYAKSRAYTAYIKNLSPGQSGFTCFASLQLPRN